jgi:hypothetical protein
MHSGASLESGDCYTWGGNELGQLGLPSTQNFTHNPEKVADLEGPILKIACGYYQTLFLTNEQTVLACGLNEDGQLGVEEDSEIVDIPIPVKGFTETIVDIYCTNFSCALSENNSLYMWGDSPNGLFTKPERINGLAETVCQVALGEDLICILDINNFVYTWGRNENGQLGLGDTESQKDACSVEILNDREVLSISAGKNFIVCLGKGATSKPPNNLLENGTSEDGNEGLFNEEIHEELQYGVGQRLIKANMPNKGYAGTQDNENYGTDDEGNDYQLIGGDTFGEKHGTHNTDEVNIHPPSERHPQNHSSSQKQQEKDKKSEVQTLQDSEKESENPVPDTYQLPKSILDLYRNQKQTEAIYPIKEVEAMQNENVVLKQLVCTYEKIRQDLVSILDAIVRQDPSLIDQLDPRDIQK